MLPNQKVIIKWNGQNKKYYTEKGYPFTKVGDEFKVEIKDVPKGSHVLVRFICDYCKGKHQIEENSQFKSYKSLLKIRRGTPKDCCNYKECKKEKQRETYITNLIENENTFGHRYPELLNEWSSKNSKSPYEYSSGTDMKVWWVCKDNPNHEWEASIYNRAKKNTGCPYCSGKIVCSDNNLEYLFPEIAKQWHPLKNNGLLPSQVTKGTATMIWWSCEKGHEWETSVLDRTSGSGCPYCSNRRVCIDNCLATTHPEIAKDWDYGKNILTPYEVTYGVAMEVWWKCKENHSYKSRVLSRSHGYGCPTCSESKGEKEIRNFLESHNISYEDQKEFKGLVGTGGGLLSYDFYLPKQNILIEYQGQFHDGSTGEYSRRYLKTQQEHDRRKKEYSRINNIELLEIWYYDFDNIEEILKSKLTK